MKSPHLLSSVHDLAICTRSAQTSHKEEDFITTSQTVVSQYSAELSHRQDRPRRRPGDSCRSRIRNSTIPHHTQQGSTQSPAWTPSHDALSPFPLNVVTQHYRRSPSADFSHLINGIRKRSARQHHQDHNDHSHTDPEPAARLAHFSSRSRLVHGNLLLPLQPRRESPPLSMSSNPLAVEGVFLSKARSFASNRPSLFAGLPRCALHAWLEL